jgi:hypothetical protein
MKPKEHIDLSFESYGRNDRKVSAANVTRPFGDGSPGLQ